MLNDTSGSSAAAATTSNGSESHSADASSFTVKAGLAQMLKGGVIMDVVNAEQVRRYTPSPNMLDSYDMKLTIYSNKKARIAEEAGACAVMALERVPADIRAQGGVARMSDPQLIKEIQAAVTIPVMAKARIGHFVECQVHFPFLSRYSFPSKNLRLTNLFPKTQILEALEVDYIDESEVLSPADPTYHVDKSQFKPPFVCGCRNLGEALRRISEGAAMIRTKGEAGTGDVIEAVRHTRQVSSEISSARNKSDLELRAYARELGVEYQLLKQTIELGRLPVVNFAAGGVATPADAALMMQLGCDGVFVGSGIFKSGDPKVRAKAIVQAVTHFKDAKVLAKVSEGLGEAMVGISVGSLKEGEKLAGRGI